MSCREPSKDGVHGEIILQGRRYGSLKEMLRRHVGVYLKQLMLLSPDSRSGKPKEISRDELQCDFAKGKFWCDSNSDSDVNEDLGDTEAAIPRSHPQGLLFFSKILFHSRFKFQATKLLNH